MIDGYDIVSTTYLVGISGTREGALIVRNLRSIDGRTAETFTIVLETCILIIVPFTESDTSLDGHYMKLARCNIGGWTWGFTVLRVQPRVVKKGTRRTAWVCETSSIDERGKVGAGRLSRFLVTPKEIDTDSRNECKGGRSCKE